MAQRVRPARGICTEGMGTHGQSQGCSMCCRALTESAVDSSVSDLQVMTCDW